jgi:hypothetical protein
MHRATAAAGIAVTLIAATAAASTGRRQHDLATLAFMAGCWRSEPGARGTVIEERYTPPAANLMLGTTRYLRGDTVVSYEFTRLETNEGRILLTPYPNGTASVAFTLVAATAASATFENPAHDFPTRILYRRGDDGSLTARIEGPDGRGQAWTMQPVQCTE